MAASITVPKKYFNDENKEFLREINKAFYLSRAEEDLNVEYIKDQLEIYIYDNIAELCCGENDTSTSSFEEYCSKNNIPFNINFDSDYEGNSLMIWYRNNRKDPEGKLPVNYTTVCSIDGASMIKIDAVANFMDELPEEVDDTEAMQLLFKYLRSLDPYNEENRIENHISKERDIYAQTT